MSKIPEVLFKRWRHSYEEDNQEEEVYRPEGYELPLSRGRSSFEIKENGEFIKYNIGPTDMVTPFITQYKVNKNSTIILILENPDLSPIEIVEYDENILKIKKKALPH